MVFILQSVLVHLALQAAIQERSLSRLSDLSRPQEALKTIKAPTCIVALMRDIMDQIQKALNSATALLLSVPLKRLMFQPW